MYNVKTLKYLIICSIKYHQKILRISRNAVIQYWMPMIFEPITQKSKKLSDQNGITIVTQKS